MDKSKLKELLLGMLSGDEETEESEEYDKVQEEARKLHESMNKKIKEILRKGDVEDFILIYSTNEGGMTTLGDMPDMEGENISKKLTAYVSELLEIAGKMNKRLRNLIFQND